MTNNRWCPYTIFKSALPVDMCNNIINAHCYKEYTLGGILTGKGDSGSVKHDLRNVHIQGTELEWLNAMLIGYTRIANNHNFDYDISDHDKERVQFSKYDVGMYFNNHMDFSCDRSSIANTRKLSVTVQLSDENDYEGGDLLLDYADMEDWSWEADSNKLVCPREQGTVIVFDSRWVHQVQPVTQGTRYSLVKWVHGDYPLR